jgi:hypothetical protein
MPPSSGWRYIIFERHIVPCESIARNMDPNELMRISRCMRLQVGVLDKNKMNFREIGRKVDWMHLAQDTDQ